MKLENSRDSQGYYVTGNFDLENKEANFLNVLVPVIAMETRTIKCVITYLDTKGRSDTIIRQANISLSGNRSLLFSIRFLRYY